jgi:hypothetical protein
MLEMEGREKRRSQNNREGSMKRNGARFACVVGALLMAGPVHADMVSGIAICSPNDSGIRWTGSSPTDLVLCTGAQAEVTRSIEELCESMIP